MKNSIESHRNLRKEEYLRGQLAAVPARLITDHNRLVRDRFKTTCKVPELHELANSVKARRIQETVFEDAVAGLKT